MSDYLSLVIDGFVTDGGWTADELESLVESVFDCVLDWLVEHVWQERYCCEAEL